MRASSLGPAASPSRVPNCACAAPSMSRAYVVIIMAFPAVFSLAPPTAVPCCRQRGRASSVLDVLAIEVPGVFMPSFVSKGADAQNNGVLCWGGHHRSRVSSCPAGPDSSPRPRQAESCGRHCRTHTRRFFAVPGLDGAAGHPTAGPLFCERPAAVRLLLAQRGSGVRQDLLLVGTTRVLGCASPGAARARPQPPPEPARPQPPP